MISHRCASEIVVGQNTGSLERGMKEDCGSDIDVLGKFLVQFSSGSVSALSMLDVSLGLISSLSHVDTAEKQWVTLVSFWADSLVKAASLRFCAPLLYFFIAKN